MASARNGITRTWQPTFSTSANADDIERAPSKSRHFKDMRVKWCCNLRDPMSIADLVRNLWVKPMAPITGHRPLHGCSPGHPGASATAVRQRCSDADGNGWASPHGTIQVTKIFPAPFEAIWDTLHFWTNICRYIIIYILHYITVY